MADVYCSVCGEPWEYYYVIHEMTPAERKTFQEGRGCPCCEGVVEAEETEVERFDRRLQAAISETEASDEDPIEILFRRRIGNTLRR